MCLSWVKHPVNPSITDHSKMNTVSELQGLFRGIQNGISPDRMVMAQYWDKHDRGYQLRFMFTMFRLSLFDWQDI